MLRPRTPLFAAATDTAAPPPPASASQPAAPEPSFDIDVSDAFAPEPPASSEPAAPASDDAPPPQGQIELSEFKPKKFDLNNLEPDDEPESQPAVAPEPPEPPKLADTAPGPKELRKAYEATKSERDALKAEKAEIEAAKLQLEQEREQLKSQLGEATKHLTYRDPSQHPDVKALLDPVNRELADLPRTALMTSKQANALTTQAPALINEFRQIGAPGTEGYDERREGFLTKVHDSFGENGDRVSSLIAKAATVMEQAERKMAEIKELGGVNGYQEAKQRYDQTQAVYTTQMEANYFQVSPEFAEANPFNSKVVIANLVNGNPKMKEAADRIKQLLRKAAIPPPPINPRELESMPPEERDAMLKGRMSEHQKLIRHFSSQAAEAQLALSVVGPLFKEVTELREKLKLKTNETPSPRGGGPTPPPDNKIEVSDFKPVTVNLRG